MVQPKFLDPYDSPTQYKTSALWGSCLEVVDVLKNGLNRTRIKIRENGETPYGVGQKLSLLNSHLIITVMRQLNCKEQKAVGPSALYSNKGLINVQRQVVYAQT